MKNEMLERVLEATRLTQAGRLAEATRLLQGSLAAPADGSSSSEVHDVIDGVWAERGVEDAPPAPPAAPSATSTAHDAPRPAAAWRDVIGRFMDQPPVAPAAPGARPVAPPAPGTVVDGTYANEAGERSYQLYVPARYAGEPMPLVVMLHGCKQGPGDFAAGTQMNVLAEETGFLVLYPAQAGNANHARCWNWFRREDQQRGAGEPSILAGMTRSVMERYAVSAGQVYAAGLSAGGAMAAVLGVTYPDLFAAVGIHSGLACGSAHDLPSALAAMKGMPPGVMADTGRPGADRAIPTIVFHGDRDRTVHPRNGAEVIARSAHHGADDTRVAVERGQAPGGHAYTKSVHRDGSGRIVLEHWLVHGGGHAWFGGSPAGSYTDARGPDAAREMMRFFLQAA